MIPAVHRRVSQSLESQIMEDLSLVGIAHCVPPMMGSRANLSVSASLPQSFPESEAGRLMKQDSETPAVVQLRGLEASAKQVGQHCHSITFPLAWA
jgi:hypothetical protein